MAVAPDWIIALHSSLKRYYANARRLQELSIMSFYHILPSDSAKDRFPNNNAAQFSIPIDGAQHLEGQWEVAVAQLSFSNCIYTFDNETITIGESRPNMIWAVEFIFHHGQKQIAKLLTILLSTF